MKKLLIALSLALAFGGAAHAQNKAVTIHPSIPPVTSVKDAPFPGWLELEAGGKQFYLSLDGRYVMLGKVLDLGPQAAAAARPATESVGGQPIDVRALPLDKAIRFVNGNGKRKLYVFSDPDCPYCKRLESEIPQLKDTTVFVFPYPIEQLHPNAPAKSAGVWCQLDRAKAWRETLSGVKTYAGTEKCLNTVKGVVELGRKLGIDSTPTMFNASGMKAVGYLPASEIDQFLNVK